MARFTLGLRVSTDVGGVGQVPMVLSPTTATQMDNQVRPGSIPLATKVSQHSLMR